ncbi:MAG: helix-turn-helix transcriptional regulator [Actinomycetota bacterium]
MATKPTKPDDAAPEEAEELDALPPGTLGAFIRAQREMANLSLRQLSTMAEISNAYLSQIERDLHEPSLRVIKRVGNALGIAPETLLSRAGLLPDDDDADAEAGPTVSTEAAILADPQLTDDEKQALLTVYRSYLATKNPAE